MAAQLATGDYDGDQFVLITNPVAVEACWARLNEAYDEDQLRRAADWREEQSQRQQQQQEEEKTAGYQPQDADAAGGSGRPSGGRAEQPAAAEWEAARAQGQLWFLKPRLAEQDPQVGGRQWTWGRAASARLMRVPVVAGKQLPSLFCRPPECILLSSVDL